MQARKHISSVNYFEKLIYRPVGLNRNTAPAFWIALAGLFLVNLMLLLTKGNIAAAGFTLLPFTLIVVTIYRVEYSFYVLLFCVLFFDQFGIPGFEPFTFTVDYFRNLKENRYLPYMAAGVVNPIELHLILIAGVWFLSLPLKRNLKFQAIPVWPAFLLFLGTFVFSFVNGIRTGDFLVALWEVRALFYLCFLYVFIPQILHSKKQIKIVVWISIIAITLKALQAIHRYIMLGFTTGGYQTLTNHEDPVFASTIFILLLGMFVFGYKGKEKWWILALCIPLALGFYFGMRRAAYAGFMVSGATFFFILPQYLQVNVLRKSVPYVLMLMLYVAVAWNSNSTFASPVQLIKTGMTEPDKETNYQDYYSNLYRDFENYNLAVTVQNNTLLGVGFGNKYEMPLKLANISFPLKDYIPHNEILWYLIKTGSIGFIMFWLFFNGFMFKGVQVLRELQDPYLRAVCAMIILAVINQVVVSYFDLQLTYYRNMIYLGTLMGLLPALINLAKKEKNLNNQQQVNGSSV